MQSSDFKVTKAELENLKFCCQFRKLKCVTFLCTGGKESTSSFTGEQQNEAESQDEQAMYLVFCGIGCVEKWENNEKFTAAVKFCMH